MTTCSILKMFWLVFSHSHFYKQIKEIDSLLILRDSSHLPLSWIASSNLFSSIAFWTSLVYKDKESQGRSCEESQKKSGNTMYAMRIIICLFQLKNQQVKPLKNILLFQKNMQRIRKIICALAGIQGKMTFF